MKENAKVSNRLIALLFILAVLLLLGKLGCRSLWGSEGRWAEVVRQMFLTGDFFHPTINGEPYFDKPLFTYWAIGLFKPFFGRLDEFTVRFPSALSGIFSLVGTFYLGQKLWNKNVAVYAALLLLTSFGFVFWARTAAADMENMAFIVAAVCWYTKFQNKRTILSYLVFYLICFIGAQFKGLTAVAVPIVVILCHICVKKTWKEHLNLANLLALILASSVYMAPFIYAKVTSVHYAQEGLAMAFRENIIRYFKAFDHREPFYVYFYYVPLLAGPWIFFLIGYLLDRTRAFSSLKDHDKWLLMSFIAIFLLFTASSSRRSYYILPILPFASLGMATFIIRPLSRRIWHITLVLQTALLLSVSVILTLNPLLWPIVRRLSGYFPPHNLPISIVISGLTALLCAAAASFHIKKRKREDKVPIFLMAGVYFLFAGFFLNQACLLERDRPLKPFVMELRPLIENVPSRAIGLSKNMASVAFYLDRQAPVVNLERTENIIPFLSQKGSKVIITRKKDMKRLSPYLEGCPKRLLLSSHSPSWDTRSQKRLEAWIIDSGCPISQGRNQ